MFSFSWMGHQTQVKRLVNVKLGLLLYLQRDSSLLMQTVGVGSMDPKHCRGAVPQDLSIAGVVLHAQAPSILLAPELLIQCRMIAEEQISQ